MALLLTPALGLAKFYELFHHTRNVYTVFLDVYMHAYTAVCVVIVNMYYAL